MPMLRSLYRHRSNALALFGGLAIGCASEREPVNRIQPNALDKTFFVGEKLSDPSDNPEFYHRPTVVDVDYGAAQAGMFTASYAQTLSRVGFEITEDLLVARLTYERVADTSGKGAPDDDSGQIVAAFKVESHFDIRRDYNPQTGEELNVLEENTSDRAWYERKFMRVDWSENLVTSAYELDTLAALKAFADRPIEYESAHYSVEDPKSADAPVFNVDDGYFDVTNKVFAKPQMIETPYGSFPACFFNADFFQGSGPAGNCNPVELKVRLSFRKVVDTDYEPVDWDGQRMEIFGAFTVGTLAPNRYGYDRGYGLVDSKWKRYASRHNIWEKAHLRDADGALVACDADAECPTERGSRCDLSRSACTMPYRDRTPRQIAYHYGPESDPTLFETARKVTAEWDTTLRSAVQTARYAECVHESGGVASESARSACAAEYPTDLESTLQAVPEILSFCHNPVTASDPEACGAKGVIARVGDLRYHMANIIEAPQTPSPWGIMSDAGDPLTGEVVAASINLWNATTDLVTQRTIDQLRWYLGEISSEDVIRGNYVKPINDLAVPGAALVSRDPPRLAQEEVEERIGSMDRTLFDPALAPNALPKLSGKALVDWASAVTRQNFGDPALGTGNSSIQARLQGLWGSPVESSLVTGPYRSLVGLSGDLPLDPSTLGMASPLRGGFLQNRSAFEREQKLRQAAAGSCVLDASQPVSAVELAKKLLAKFPLADDAPGTPGMQATADHLNERNAKWRDYLRKRLTFGVLGHEMGHSMGLRHVFTSSFDAINYRPQYWQLRTRDKQETSYCSEPATDGTSCIGPRWNDPVTDTERDGMLGMWQQTSVMDYPGDITQEFLDIGAYDRAAIRFLYADVSEVWADPNAKCALNAQGGEVCTPDGSLLEGQLGSFGGIQGPYYGLGSGLDPIHYSRLDQRMNLIRDCRPADTSPPADWNEAENGVYDPVLDGGIVNGTVCSGPPVDHVRFADLVAIDTPNGVQRKFDASGRVRRPYMFASDEYADIGNIAVYRDDNGADAYEVASFFINDFEDKHVFDNHRRGRTSFTLSGAFSRAYSKYHEKLKEMSKGYALLQEVYAGSQLLDTISSGELGDALSKPHALATSLAFDHFSRLLTRPTSGDHFLDARLDPVGKRILRSTDQSIYVAGPLPNQGRSLMVPEGTQQPGFGAVIGGRPLHNALDSSQGYYSTQYDLWVGSYYEKTLALELLADSTDRFISQSRDDFVDGRYRNVSFATLYPEGIRRLVATALTGDADMLGWRVPSQNGQPRVESGTALPLAPLGFKVWWPEAGPTTCWPGVGQLGCGSAASAGNPAFSEPSESVAVDPEVGFEVQKFVILFSLLYLPESWKRDWVDLMRIYQLGADTNPEFSEAESVVFYDPISGARYVAHTYGKETIDARSVERGIGGRVLEWANRLAAKAYEVSATDPVTGELSFERYADDSECPNGVSRCEGQPRQIDASSAARLRNYKSVIDFTRRVTGTLGFYGPSWRGIY